MAGIGGLLVRIVDSEKASKLMEHYKEIKEDRPLEIKEKKREEASSASKGFFGSFLGQLFKIAVQAALAATGVGVTLAIAIQMIANKLIDYIASGGEQALLDLEQDPMAFMRQAALNGAFGAYTDLVLVAIEIMEKAQQASSREEMLLMIAGASTGAGLNSGELMAASESPLAADLDLSMQLAFDSEDLAALTETQRHVVEAAAATLQRIVLAIARGDEIDEQFLIDELTEIVDATTALPEEASPVAEALVDAAWQIASLWLEER